VQYTAQFNQAGFVNVLFGQSYHLLGQNSFAMPDVANTGLSSGLETQRSDYVARLAYQPDNVYTFISRFLLDEDTFRVRRVEVEGARLSTAGRSRPCTATTTGSPRSVPRAPPGVTGQVTFKFTQNWSVLAAARYDIEARQINQHRIGLGYIDDCFAISLNYLTDLTTAERRRRTTRCCWSSICAPSAVPASVRVCRSRATATATDWGSRSAQSRARARRGGEDFARDREPKSHFRNWADAKMVSAALSSTRRAAGPSIVAAFVLVAAQSVAQAQIVALVNGDPITALDITHRTKLLQLSTQKRLAPEVLDELIDDRLKVQIGKRYIADVPKREIETAYASIARRAA